ncbi:hypothetical protein GCM10011611_35210 [Aliidongia dinghuensis]|uniref:Sensory/regulatory protein RpfC n=1 Tax=Aliidongia dinghuensis TaxID=1867774 RepID=A0A8J3E4D2_9PROT|nr:MASE1 domain-containing protein [Aliidongia dinghuensis]GGF26114.1 hypothetical protein GCM10011611_35210 [Aliidongia dinghuensis]
MISSPGDRRHTPHSVRFAGSLVLVAVAYYLAARAGLQLQFQSSQATPVWPPSGVALASFLRLGTRAAGPVFVGAFLANMADFFVKAGAGSLVDADDLVRHFSAHPLEIAVSGAIGVGNMLEAAVAHLMIRRLVPGGDFGGSVRGVLLFVLSALVGCLVSSTIGVSTLFAGSYLPAPVVRTVWLTWWLGDVTGMLILAPAIVIWAGGIQRPAAWRPALEILPALLVASLAAMVFDAWLGATASKALAYAFIPLLLWIEVRFGNGAGSLGVAIISVIAVTATVYGRGPFADEPQNDALLDLQSFVAVVAVTTALLSAALRERTRAVAALREAHRTLEQRVEQRTDQLARANEELLAATEQSRQIQAALARSKEDYKGLYVRTPALMHSIDTDGRLLSVSDHWLSTLGYSREEVIGRRSTEFLTEESRRYAREVVLPEFFRTGVCMDIPYQLIRKDGSLIDVLLSGVGERDQSGRIVRSLAVMVDVTERNRAEAALRASEARLLEEKSRAEDASRAKSEFLANMSHEIRTPLNGVIGLADLLLGSELTETQRRHANLLKDSGKSLLAILNDILDLSKIESGKVELASVSMSLGGVAEAAMAIVRPQGEAKGLTLELELADDLPPWTLGDPIRLRQVLLNLLSNAVKFTERGLVRLSVAMRPAEASLAVHFTVTDTGIGVPTDRRHLLFENFSQVDRSIHRRFGGTGLGLAISKRLVEGMGGEIGFTSNDEGHGSVFWFMLPVRAAASPTPSILSPSAGAAARPLRILVAEDIPINQLVVEATLTAAGHEVALAANGTEAVRTLAAGAFDLVLMDVEMPEMDGMAATRAIRALDGACARVPIIALTANAMDEQIRLCRASGMDDHLAKPIDREQLLAMVDKWVPPDSRQETHSTARAGGSAAD